MISLVHRARAVCLSTLVLNDNTTGEVYIIVTGQVLHYVPGGTRVETAPDACVLPSVAFVPKPAASTVIPRPPGDKCGNPHARIMCENNDGQTLPSRNASTTLGFWEH
ncbi:unnamed protein product [Rhizophagus irregularis]|nr:unnamed protein product [Rhizophagus irregularis]